MVNDGRLFRSDGFLTQRTHELLDWGCEVVFEDQMLRPFLSGGKWGEGVRASWDGAYVGLEVVPDVSPPLTGIGEGHPLGTCCALEGFSALDIPW